MAAKVTWHDGLSFTGTADTGFEVSLGASASVGGAEDGFRPMELLAVGLAGCTAMDVISILQKHHTEQACNRDSFGFLTRLWEHTYVFFSHSRDRLDGRYVRTFQFQPFRIPEFRTNLHDPGDRKSQKE